jgi:hypothetical protein
VDDGYAPWRGQQVSAWLALAAIVAVVVAAQQEWVSTQAALIGVALLALYAIHAFNRVRARQRGKAVEHTAIRALCRELNGMRGIRTATNVRMRSGADIDVVITVAGRDMPVEIKSYGRWKTYFFGLWPGARERATIRQVRRQMAEVKAIQALVWLPHGRPGLWQRWAAHPRAARNIHLVFGNADRVAAIIANAQASA